MRSVNDDCLFCRMASGKIEVDVVHETDRTLAFRDIDRASASKDLGVAVDQLVSLGLVHAQQS